MRRVGLLPAFLFLQGLSFQKNLSGKEAPSAGFRDFPCLGNPGRNRACLGFPARPRFAGIMRLLKLSLLLGLCLNLHALDRPNALLSRSTTSTTGWAFSGDIPRPRHPIWTGSRPRAPSPSRMHTVPAPSADHPDQPSSRVSCLTGQDSMATSTTCWIPG